MTADPLGYYARLGVSPAASAAEITAAFRRLARRLHPDIPRTGNAEAFVALKAAYDVLGDPLRRAAYDRTARPKPRPLPAAPPIATASPSLALSGLSLVVWLGVLSVAVVAVIGAIFSLSRVRSAAPPPAPEARVMAPVIEPPSRTAPNLIKLTGPWTDYVIPGDGPAPLWQEDPSDSHQLRLIARLPAFTMVHTIGTLPDRGLVIVALGGGDHAFVDALRLAPGGAEEARRAYCADQAGTPPSNAEILGQRGSGSAKVVIHNRGEEPAVVKLRDQNERTLAEIYVAPGVTATVLNLPGGPWQADVAMGEMWSRACRIFAAGMQAEHVPGEVDPGHALTIPPELPPGVPPTDIPDQAFRRD